MAKRSEKTMSRTIGVDLSKRSSQVCVVVDGDLEREFKVSNTAAAWEKAMEGIERGRLVMEVGGASPWVSRLLTKMGFDVWVVAPTALKTVWGKQRRKTDRDDARGLALAGAQSPNMLKRITHGSEAVQRDRLKIVQRDALVRTRTTLISSLRGSLSSLGVDFPKCATTAINRRVQEHVPEYLREAFAPLLIAIATISAQIKKLEDEIDELAKQRYPATNVISQINGVGTLTALAFILRVENPERFPKNRAVGAYFGLAQGRDQSGDSDPQMPITKMGDTLMRRLLVQCANYMLGRFGQDSDLRRFGLALCASGAKGAKKRARVAVARRLAVLMLSLWKTGEVYEPLRLANRRPAADSAASTN